ncbi:hypothetical protein SAMN03080601_02744 [Alkalitalea saponilacus]|uniref:Uncharacterized protein n=1 Tax=Alkalitalea saponilacus TaxID=889453 RepID=A0A1T5HSH1_9BACT|nr:hypothetical protein SAMN03080601_02744 [Alkalitalea saponilacus]
MSNYYTENLLNSRKSELKRGELMPEIKKTSIPSGISDIKQEYNFT